MSAKRFFKGQDVTLLPNETSYGKVVGIDRGHVMVRWNWSASVGDMRDLNVVTGHPPNKLRGLPPGYGS